MSEAPQVYCEVKRKARKDHSCYECRGVIKQGEQYVYCSGIWDGPDSYKLCPECHALMHEVVDEASKNWDTTSGFGNLYEDIFEGEDVSRMQRYVTNAQNRKGNLGKDNWMLEKLNTALQLG